MKKNTGKCVKEGHFVLLDLRIDAFVVFKDTTKALSKKKSISGKTG